jgi:hypothetical protein
MKIGRLDDQSGFDPYSEATGSDGGANQHASCFL